MRAAVETKLKCYSALFLQWPDTSISLLPDRDDILKITIDEYIKNYSFSDKNIRAPTYPCDLGLPNLCINSSESLANRYAIVNYDIKSAVAYVICTRRSYSP